jgi:hypothetical protein
MLWIQFLSFMSSVFADLIGYNRLGNNVFKHSKSSVRRRSSAADQVLHFLILTDDLKTAKQLFKKRASRIAKPKTRNIRRLLLWKRQW